MRDEVIMKFEFTDSNGTYYTFNPVDYVDQLEVGAPDRRGIPIVQIRFNMHSAEIPCPMLYMMLCT